MFNRISRFVMTLCLLAALPLVAAVSIALNPTTATVNQGATKQFTAVVTGSTNTGITWTVTGTGNGTVSTAGLYTAPLKAGSFTLTAHLSIPARVRADKTSARNRPFGLEPVTAFARPPVGDSGGGWEGIRCGAVRINRSQPSPPFMKGEGRDPDEAGAKNRGGIPSQEPAKRREFRLSSSR